MVNSTMRMLMLVTLLLSKLSQQTAVQLFPRIVDGTEITGVAIEVKQYLNGNFKRQSDTVGSWALRALTCPENTQDCENGSIKACCTTDTICVEHLSRVACCPSKERCDLTAESLPSCADPSWSLWKNEDRDKFFCCLPGQKGYRTSKKLGACGDDDIVLQPTQTLTSVIPYNAKGGATGGSGADGTRPTSSGDTQNEETSSSDNTNSETDTQNEETSSSKNTNSSSSSGLSTGAIAGIAAGGAALLIAFATGVWLARRAGARKGAAATTAAIHAQQQQETFQNQHHAPLDRGMSEPGYLYQQAPGTPLGHQPYEAVKPGNAGDVNFQSTQTETPPPQWAHEVDGHRPEWVPKGYSEMEGR